MKYSLSNNVEITVFDDNEALLTLKSKKETCILNSTALTILNLILTYELNEAKKQYLKKFTNKANEYINNELISDFEDVFNIFLKNQVIVKKEKNDD